MSDESTISYEEFSKVELRAGTVVRAEEFPAARKPAYKIWVDFGELGVRQTSAQVTEFYRPEELVGLRVVGVVNLPPKRIAGFESQFLLTGFDADGGGVVLAQPEREVPNGSRLY
ncbi:MAG TPA: tRNA-binding protein [Trueperaceae bacterium]